MARTISMETLENKIEKAQENVSKARVRYEEATSELKKLLDKKKALQTDELVKAISISQRSYEVNAPSRVPLKITCVLR